MSDPPEYQNATYSVLTSIDTDYNGRSIINIRQHITLPPSALAFLAWQDMNHAA